MRVRALVLDKDGLPEEVTVDMTRAEAILIADYVGNLTPSTIASTGIWDALSGSVFVPFWEDGLADARRKAPTTETEEQK